MPRGTKRSLAAYIDNPSTREWLREVNAKLGRDWAAALTKEIYEGNLIDMDAKAPVELEIVPVDEDEQLTLGGEK